MWDINTEINTKNSEQQRNNNNPYKQTLEDETDLELLSSFPKPKFKLGEKVLCYREVNPKSKMLIQGIICLIIQYEDFVVYGLENTLEEFKESELRKFPE